MPAGRGVRCEDCYWISRVRRSTDQLTTLFHSKRVKKEFSAFAEWLPTQATPQRAALRLAKHAEFFEMLDEIHEGEWTSAVLLQRLGSATLRKFELPLRWLKLHAGLVVAAEDKSQESELRRVNRAVTQIPQGTFARELIDQFRNELASKCKAGNLTQLSMRLAIRPAISLLSVEAPDWSRAPTQKALEKYLLERPGQRAAVSSFLGYLRKSHGIKLRLPSKPSASSVVVRKALERQIAEFIRFPNSEVGVVHQWTRLALRYFHHLSAADARLICSHGIEQPSEDGKVFFYMGSTYWIPAEPRGGYKTS